MRKTYLSQVNFDFVSLHLNFVCWGKAEFLKLILITKKMFYDAIDVLVQFLLPRKPRWLNNFFVKQREGEIDLVNNTFPMTFGWQIAGRCHEDNGIFITISIIFRHWPQISVAGEKMNSSLVIWVIRPFPKTSQLIKRNQFFSRSLVVNQTHRVGGLSELGRHQKSWVHRGLMGTGGKVTNRIAVEVNIMTWILSKNGNNGGAGVWEIPRLAGVDIPHSIELTWVATDNVNVFEVETSESHFVIHVQWKNNWVSKYSKTQTENETNRSLLTRLLGGYGGTWGDDALAVGIGIEATSCPRHGQVGEVDKIMSSSWRSCSSTAFRFSAISWLMDFDMFCCWFLSEEDFGDIILGLSGYHGWLPAFSTQISFCPCVRLRPVRVPS